MERGVGRGERAEYLIGRNMVESELVAFSTGQVLIITTRRLEHGERADYVCLNERSRAID